jgi:two-component system phosphate regulon sensor histidine kinase PhoR
MIETGSASFQAATDKSAAVSARVGQDEPASAGGGSHQPVAGVFARIRRRLTFRRRVTDGAVRSSPRLWRGRSRFTTATAGQVRLPIVVTFVVAMFVATIALVSFGYVATREWRSGTNRLLERRANEALALVRATLRADMKGAWITAIVPFNTINLDEDPPYSMFQVSARTFAQFPYPESFVLWKHTRLRQGSGGASHSASGATAAGRDEGTTYAFNRADRSPPWETRPSSDDPFPVVLDRDPPALAGLVAAVQKHATAASPFIMLERPIDGTPYQIVAHALFASSPPHALLGFMAFTVNEQWLQTEYFDPLVEQVEKIGGSLGGLSITVSDDKGRVVTKAAPVEPDAGDLHTRFPLLFIDPALVKSISSFGNARDLPSVGRGTSRPSRVREWTVHVRPLPDQALLATLQGARRMFVLISIAAGASLVALVLTLRADRASAALASMKSDFVAAVTHELKTPVAFIRLVGDTLGNGRYTSPKTVQEYAGLLSVEASRLGSSIDNLLTYARYSSSGVASATELADVEPADLVEDALQGMRPVLANLEFELMIDVPPDLPQICVDRPAMIQALDNIVDNAIKYSTTVKHLTVTGTATAKSVTLTVRDRGTGIAGKDLSRIFERFYRGGNVTVSGSGLGLPIAKRIVESHGGRIEVRSTVGSGTEVDVTLPIGRVNTRQRSRALERET